MFKEDSTVVRRSLINMPISMELNGLRCSIYWARIIKGKSESLLTINTKHTVFEIEYAVKHPLTIQIGNEAVRLSEGEFIIIPPDTPHQIIGSNPEGIKLICGFRPDDISFSVFKNSFISLKSMKAGDTVKGLSGIIDKYEDENALSKESTVLCSLLFSLLAAFTNDAAPDWVDKEESVYSENEMRMQAFLKMVGEKNGVGISVSEAAAFVNLSERQLFRICMSTVGRTPGEIINEKKLRYIIFCLMFTPLALSEIADICGFQTEYSMTKFFKRYEKMNPSAYRKLHRNSKEFGLSHQ